MSDTLRLALVVLALVLLAAECIWEIAAILTGVDRLMITSLIRTNVWVERFVYAQIALIPAVLLVHFWWERSLRG